MRKKLLLVFLSISITFPAYAVFNEKNISRTISVLRHELHSTWQDKAKQDVRHEKTSQMEEVQQKDMVNTIKWINELTLILYSQENGFTLNRSYATDDVFYEYKKFNEQKRPRFTDTRFIDTEIERYKRLIDALKLLPPTLDGLEREDFNTILDSLVSSFDPISIVEKPSGTHNDTTTELNLLEELASYVSIVRNGNKDEIDKEMIFLSQEAQADRDSCIAYANAIILSYTKQKERIQKADFYFSEMKKKLDQTYGYARSCFEEIKNYIFVTGQENYFHVLANFKKYAQDTAADMEQQYGTGDSEQDWEGLRESQWRWVGLVSALLYSLSHLLVISVFVILMCCVVLKKIKPFNTEWFRQTRPAVLLLVISVLYSMLILTSGLLFPMSNFIYIAAIRILIYLWFVIALLLSILIGIKKEDVRNILSSFTPVLVLGLLLMLCRSMFLPDKMIHMTLTPLLIIFLLWQIHLILKFNSKRNDYKNIAGLHNVTVAVFALSLLASVQGYSLLAIMFLMWWIFQVAALATLAALSYVLKYCEKNRLAKKKEQYASTHNMISCDKEGDYIRVTWFYDLLCKAVIPVAGILSLLGCIWLALGTFHLTELTQIIFHKTFFDFKGSDGSPILEVSFFKLAIICIYFFIYRYLYYIIRSLYRVNTFEKVMKKSGKDTIRANEVNLSLANNVIGVIIWGLFTCYAIIILKIPIGALSIVVAGLATGVGLALKDILNNFIYGIQLMSGRLRVGDVLECDGVRGTVEKISYQSTEIQTLSGAVISFTNTSLFNKNFQNLTKNSPYEFTSIIVSISYGEDIGNVRSMISDSLKEFTLRKDKYGRYLVEKKNGIRITLDNFGDSCVNLAIQQDVLVEFKFTYMAEVKEHVYKLFNENGIVFPFPQQEVSILNLPDKTPADL